MDEEFLLKHDRARIQSRVNALKSVNQMGLPKMVVISDDSFSGLGLKTSRGACKNLESLREAYGDKLPYLIGLSLRETWFSLFDSSGYIALMADEGAMGDNDYTQKFATAEGYGGNEGIAWTLYNSLIDLEETQQQATFRDGTPFEERLSDGDILKGAAMYWLAAAATSLRAGDLDSAFDWLHEAQDALSIAHGNYMWDEGEKVGAEGALESSVDAVAAARTALAKAGAKGGKARNRPRQEIKDWAIAQTATMRGAHKEIARSLSRQLPKHFVGRSDDPERLIYDALRKATKRD